MKQTALAARWCAVHDLQQRRAASLPGSLPWRVADHASVLALSQRRPTTPYLAINALRDARIIVLRRDRLDRVRHPVSFFGTADDPDSLELTVEASGALDTTHLQSLPPTPEAELIWTDLYRRIRERLNLADARLPDVLDAWRDGETVAATAERLAVSAGLVKKLRRKAAEVALQVRAEINAGR